MIFSHGSLLSVLSPSVSWRQEVTTVLHETPSNTSLCQVHHIFDPFYPTTSTTTTSPWRQFHIDLHRSREILLLSAQLFPWVFGVRCWGFAEFQGLHCPEEAAHQHWRAASEFTCVPLPSSHRDSRQQWRGPPHCSPLISTNEFLCGKEQTALQ